MQSLWMVVSALFFAFYAVFVKLAGLDGISSFEVLFYRSIFGLIVFSLMMQRKGIGFTTRYPFDHGLRSFVGAGAILAGIYSISHLNIGLAMTLNYTSPLFLGCFAIATAIRTHGQINWKLLSTLILGFGGVVTMLSPTIAPHEYGAALVGLSAGFCTSVAVSFVKRLGVKKEPELRILFYFVLVGMVTGLVGTFITGGFHAPSMAGWCYLLGISVTATCAQFCLTRAFSRGNIVLSGALQYTVILFSTVMGEIVFAEPVTIPVVIGMIIIVVTGILASLLTRKEQKKASEHIKERQRRAGMEV